MIKKIGIILSIAILCFTSMKFDVYADGKYNRNLIKGNTREISMQLNKSVFTKSDEAILINENSIVDSITATPLAFIKNAPIIPIELKEIDANTEDYLDSLDVRKITIIGGIESISINVENHLKQLGYEVNRIYGDNRYETSIEIAKEINKIKKVKDVIIIYSSVGLENALGIYSFAAQQNTPIIWSDGENFKDVKSFIDNNQIEKVYAIGNLERFNNKLKENIGEFEVIKEINKIQSNIKFIKNIKNNRIDKVYTVNVKYGSLLGNNECISLGVVAAKQNIPIFICEGSLTKPQEIYLEKNNIDNLDEIGTITKDYNILNTLMNKSFLYSMILIVILIVMLIRAFIHEV